MAAVAGTKVGAGFVEIHPDFSRFQERVGKQLNQALAPALQKVGKTAGREVTKGVDREVSRSSFAPALKRFERFGAEAGEAISKGLRKRRGRQQASAVADGLGLDAMSEFFDRARKDSQRSMPVIERLTLRVRNRFRELKRDFHGVGGEIRQLAGQHLRGLGAELRKVASEFHKTDKRARVTSSGFGGFDGAMSRVNRGAQFFRNILRTIKWPVFIAGIGLSLQGLSALAAGAVAAASALGSLSGVMVALPAAALAGAQAFGAFKLATSGVGDAVKAALAVETSGGQQAVDVLRQQRDAAERVSDAKRNLIDVQKQAENAQDDLREARESATRQLQDMRLAAEATGTSEKQAALSLREARRELARTLADPAASGLDVQGAEIAVEQARDDLQSTRVEAKRIRQDYRDAQKKGVEGMPEVVSAKEAEADANRAITDAQRDLRRATEDATAAMESQGSAASALQEKMAQLPAAGQKFVRFLVSLKPRLDALRATAAEGFLPGAEKGLKGALRNFGVFRGLIDGTSKSLGRLAAKAGQRLGNDVWGRDLSRLGKLNTRIIDRMGDAGLNLANALRHVLVSAEPFLDWLSESTLGLSQWVKGEAAAGRETGRLGDFFDRTRETMERLGPILKGVGGALLNVSEGADSLGNEILDSLGDAAEGWRKWTDSTQGKSRLKTYFTETKPAIFEMGKLIRDVGKAFFELGKQEGVAELLRLVRTQLVPAMRDLVGATTGWAAQFLEDFGRLRKGGVPAFDAFVQVLAEHAGEAGIRIAKALVRAFLNAGIWGKVAIGGFLLAKFGGFRAFGKWGAEAGGRLGQRLFKAAAKWIAGTAAGENLLGWFQGTFSKEGRFGKVASTSGRNVGKLLGRGVVIGMIAGFALYRDDIETAIDKHIIDPLKDKLEDLPGPLGAVADALEAAYDNRELFDPANLGPVPTALGIDVKGFVEDRYSDVFDIPAPNTDKAEKGFERFRRHVGREAQLTREAFRNQLDLLPGVAERSGRGLLRQMLPRLDALKVQGGAKGDAFAGRVGHSFGSLAKAAKTAFDNIGFNVREMLRALGGKAPKFNVQKALKEMPELPSMQQRQQGGFIVPGAGSGDTFKTMLPVGSFVENRKAVRRLPFQDGGMVPVALEPGERVHFPERVRQIGANVLRARNEEVPRFGFQRGGSIGPEPKITGPMGGLRTVGRMAIKKVYEGAKDYMDKRNSPGGAGGPLGSTPGALGALEKLASSFGLGVTSGYRPGDDGYHGINRARDFGGPADKMLAFAAAAARRFGRRMLELIHTPLGWGIKDGHRVGLGFWGPEVNADHYDHVHGAMQKGGFVGELLQRFREGGFVDATQTQKNVALAIGRNLLPRGLNYKGAAGIIGNAWRESLWNPGSEGTGGGGLYGFTAGAISLANLKATAAHAGRPWTDIDFQNDFMWEGPEPASRLKGALNSQPNAAAAAELFDTEWERSGVKAMSDRKNGAREAMRLMADAGMAPSGEGEGAAPKEDIPAVFRGAKTGNLDFGPKPRTVKEVDKQIDRWQKKAPVYRKAKRDAERLGKPGTARAIGENLTKIEERLSALRSLRTQLRLKEVRKRLNKRFGKASGRFEGYEQIIEASQLDYEKAFQDAEQIVGLEPLSPELPASATDGQREAAEKSYVAQFTSYVDTRERPAYQTVLDRVADWRNNILRAERFGFGKGSPSVAASEGAWEGETRGVRARIEKIQRFSDAVQERVEKFKREHKGEPLPEGLKKQVAERDAMRKELPVLKLRDTRLSDAIVQARGRFFPGGENRLDELPMGKRVQAPLPGSGSLEEKLREVQGIHWPEQHELLSAGEIGGSRVAGRFGGVVWDLQETIEGLGLKISQAFNGAGGGNSGDEGNSELVSLLREIAEREHKGRLVSEKLADTISFFGSTYGDLPKFHSGGVTPGPSAREFPALLKGHETVRTAEQELSLISAIRGVAAGGLGGVPVVETHIHGDIVSEYPDPVETVIRDPRTKRVIQRTRGSRVTAGGARR